MSVVRFRPKAPIVAGVAQLAEQLICNQQVAGSSPIASLYKFHIVGRFPSGQREQTVNLPSQTSMVRIHPQPPHAEMAELADALDSGSSEHYAHAGSSPVFRTRSSVHTDARFFYLLTHSKVSAKINSIRPTKCRRKFPGIFIYFFKPFSSVFPSDVSCAISIKGFTVPLPML